MTFVEEGEHRLAPDSKIRLRTHRLSPILLDSRGSLLLFIGRELYRAFLGAPVNVLLLAAIAGTSLIRYASGSVALSGYVLPQLVFWPLLMAVEEWLHILVYLRERGPDEDVELVTVHRVTGKGRSLICYGGAVRFGAHLEPVDRIRISAPGPVLSLIAAPLIWSLISLARGRIFVPGAHLAALPTLLYLLSGLWPIGTPFPTDMSNILRAKKDGRLSWRQTLGVMFGSLGLVWKALGCRKRNSKLKIEK